MRPFPFRLFLTDGNGILPSPRIFWFSPFDCLVSPLTSRLFTDHTARRYTENDSGTRRSLCLLFRFSFVSFTRSDTYPVPGFHDVNVLFPMWRITESNR